MIKSKPVFTGPTKHIKSVAKFLKTENIETRLEDYPEHSIAFTAPHYYLKALKLGTNYFLKDKQKAAANSVTWINIRGEIQGALGDFPVAQVYPANSTLEQINKLRADLKELTEFDFYSCLNKDQDSLEIIAEVPLKDYDTVREQALAYLDSEKIFDIVIPSEMNGELLEYLAMDYTKVRKLALPRLDAKSLTKERNI